MSEGFSGCRVRAVEIQRRLVSCLTNCEFSRLSHHWDRPGSNDNQLALMDGLLTTHKKPGVPVLSWARVAYIMIVSFRSLLGSAIFAGYTFGEGHFRSGKFMQTEVRRRAWVSRTNLHR